jgi:hypothetical protein
MVSCSPSCGVKVKYVKDPKLSMPALSERETGERNKVAFISP